MSFSSTGYAIVPLFRPEEIHALRAVVADHMERVSRALLIPAEELAQGAAYDERIERLADNPSYAQLLGGAVATDAQRAPAAEAIANDPRLTQAAEALIGMKVSGRTARFRGNSSAMSQQRQHWHSDVSIDDGGSCSTVRLAAWIPLIDAGPESGGLEIAAGMRDAPLDHGTATGRFNIADDLLADAPKVQPRVPVGSCLFMDRYTPHRALPNVSGKTRWSFVVWLKAG